MKLSRKWLSEFVAVDANDKKFAEAMTLSGSKVEITEDLGAEIQNVAAGRIVKMERHPDSDHMWVCQLDVGKEEPVQIVTGAWNIHEGDMVPVALHKSTLPGGKDLRRYHRPKDLVPGLDVRRDGGLLRVDGLVVVQQGGGGNGGVGYIRNFD